MNTDAIRTRRWTRLEYDRLITMEFLGEDEPIELVGGQLMVAEPQGSEHAVGVSMIARALGRAFGPDWYVMVQLPVALDAESEPEPDVAVAAGHPRDYRSAHPSRPALVVEVAEFSLDFDRRDKGSLYARASLPEYWIVNLVDRTLEVYRTPAPAPDAPYGWAYRDAQRIEPGAVVSPLALPHTAIQVTDLLP
jgi:Uma2 family endonuclease